MTTITSTRLSTHAPKRSLCFLTSFLALLLLVQMQAINFPLSFSLSSSSSLWPIFHQNKLELHRTRSMLQDSVTFLPLKDLRFAKEPMSGNTWFMSSIDDTHEDGEAQHLYFPSSASKGRLLCLFGNHTGDGAKNSYALAWPEALPHNATLLGGLTFMSDTYYDYHNIWHGLTAITPFVAWHLRKECVAPARWVLFHWGELRTRMSPWLQTLVEASIGKVTIENFENGGRGPACFEKVVVFRHSQGAMGKKRKEEVYDLMRCKTRSYCNISQEIGDPKAIRLTLLLRDGSRSFKDEPAVIRIFDRECGKVDGCRFKVARSNNLTFCDQVKLLSDTDILLSAHGAQMANLFFMDKNSSIMEFYPKGWRELAGAGQYVFRWLAEWARMRHQGSWWDPKGEPCTHSDRGSCLSHYKDAQLGHDEAYFANWTAKVLNEVKEYKLTGASKNSSPPQPRSRPCPCG
ncbi:uncharacterized protein LOC103719100 [Phoenix dactylifera]|uniref:Uncharacterized protein LOC103719100 n=1 Tax=Phoenix dactylifera TaxID=42345 RepID=A0A8B7CUK4_PHODC|nr:uncharacterized protein LOC103719100 [Phoenix dactylifera]